MLLQFYLFLFCNWKMYFLYSCCVGNKVYPYCKILASLLLIIIMQLNINDKVGSNSMGSRSPDHWLINYKNTWFNFLKLKLSKKQWWRLCQIAVTLKILLSYRCFCGNLATDFLLTLSLSLSRSLFLWKIQFSLSYLLDFTSDEI